MAGALCVKCGVVLAPILLQEGLDIHPTCGDTEASNMVFGEPLAPLGEDPLKPILTEIILWADRNAARSKQVALGASELGTPCDRRLGYRVAGISAVNNRMDPWPAIVGTGMHDWLEQAVLAYQKVHGVHDFLTETRVQPDPMIQSRSDLYQISTASVIDWKSAGPTVMRKLDTGIMPPGYIPQLNTYGLGYEKLGYPVKDVVLIFLPRCGWLNDMFVHREPYNRAMAEEAIARPYRIGRLLMQLDVLNNPHRWEQVPAAPGNCTWCPMYVKRDAEIGANETGCPGR